MALPLVAQVSVPTMSPIQGIRCDRMEGTAYHVHAHLTILNHGKPVDIPDDVGRPIFAPCIYWLHTHTSDGIIHVEAPMVRTFTLGQFFEIWGEPLSRTRAADARVLHGEKMTVWVNGQRYSGDPKTIALAEHTDITIEVGSPANKPAPFDGWGQL